MRPLEAAKASNNNHRCFIPEVEAYLRLIGGPNEPEKRKTMRSQMEDKSVAEKTELRWEQVVMNEMLQSTDFSPEKIERLMFSGISPPRDKLNTIERIEEYMDSLMHNYNNYYKFKQEIYDKYRQYAAENPSTMPPLDDKTYPFVKPALKKYIVVYYNYGPTLVTALGVS